MGITILTLTAGLMLTCETSKCKVEICNFDNLFLIKIIMALLCEQTLLLHLYTVKIMLRLVTCNRLVNLGISKQQHLYLKTKNLI